MRPANQRTTLPLRERDITAQIMDYLHVRGCYPIKILGGLGMRRGTPDILACWQGRFLAIEVKAPSRRTSERGGLSIEQWEHLERVKQAGGIALVAYDLDDVIKAMEE